MSIYGVAVHESHVDGIRRYATVIKNGTNGNTKDEIHVQVSKGDRVLTAKFTAQQPVSPEADVSVIKDPCLAVAVEVLTQQLA